MNVRKRFVGLALAISMLFENFPIYTSTEVNAVTRPRKEDDEKYNPTFSFAANNQAYYDNVKAETDTIPEIGRLPKLDEFMSLTGYSNSTITLTKFRELYGTGEDFTVPTDEVHICLTDDSEFILFGSLVNNTAEGETSVEQGYYSTAYYELGMTITLPSTLTTYQPIGTADYPFGGTLDGCEFEIKGVQIKGTAVDTYTAGYFGVFGVTSSTATIKNLGITGCVIDLPYIVAADVGILVGKNGGTVEDCYINNRKTCKVSVSNSTAGGITAENYGTIRRCYVEAFIDVDVDAGSYSEPQPFATVNHTGGTVEVNTCYYCNWIDASYFLNVNASDITADNGTIDCIYGWKYLGDTAQILGTGLYYKDFIEANMPGTNFKSGSVDFRMYTSWYSNGSYFYRVKELPHLLGEDNKFNSTIADYIKSQIQFSLVDEEDWKVLVQKNNKRGNTSDIEQQFYSTLTYKIVGKDNRGKATYNTNATHIFDVSASIEPLGTDDYPFNGTIDVGYNVPDTLVRFHLNNGEQSPLFGTLGSKARISCFAWYGPFPAFQVDGYLDPAKFIDNGYRGILVNKLLRGGYFRPRCLDTTNYAGGAVSGHLYIDTNSTYYNEHEVEIKSYSWDDLGIIGYCYGNIDDAGFAMGYEVQNDIDDTIVFTNYFISNYTKITYNNTTAKRMPDDTTSKYAKTYSTDVNYLKGYDLSPSSYIISNSWRPNSIKTIMIDTYPSLSKPDIDEDGNLLITTASNFLWLLTYATGQKAKLTNSIDLSNLKLKGTTRNGYYTLNGERPESDTTDISNYITINDDNEQKDCYALINLQLADGPLSSNNNTNNTKYVDWSNLYLIGGTFTNNDSVNKYSYILCKTMTNVHTSMDIVLYNYVGVNVSDAGDTITMCHTANYSSNNNNIYNYATNWLYYFGMGITNNYCITYNTLKDSSVSIRSTWNLGLTNNYCITRATTENTKVAETTLVYGLGRNCYHCKADGVYDYRNGTNYPVFGYLAQYCVFSGKLYCEATNNRSVYLANDKLQYSYITSEAIFEGSYCGISSNDYQNLVCGTFRLSMNTASYVVSGGTYDTVLADIYYIAYDEDLQDDTRYAVLGATKKLKATPNIYTINCSHAKFNGTLHFTTEHNTPIENTAFYGAFYLMTGSYNTNYIDIDLGNFGYIESFSVCNSSDSINYGNITATDKTSISKLCVVRQGTNFGDVLLYNPTGYYSDYHIIERSYDCKNYGNIDILFNKDNLPVSYFRLWVAGELNENETYSAYNYGDISIRGIGENKIKTGTYIYVYTASHTNYGNVEIKNIEPEYSLNLENGYSDYGIYDLHDLKCNLLYMYRNYAYLGRVALDYNDYSTINIYDCIVGSTLSIFDSAYNRYDDAYYKQTMVKRNNIDIHNITFTDDKAHLDITGGTGGSNKAYDLDIDTNISIDNIQGQPYIYIRPLRYNYSTTDAWADMSYNWRLNGKVMITNSNLNYFNITAGETCTTGKGIVHNNQDVYVSNVNTKADNTICGGFLTYNTHTYCSVIHSGNIHADIGGNLYIVGVNNFGATAQTEDSVVLWQAGDIYAKATGIIAVYGIARNTDSVANTHLYNAINSGNIVIDTVDTSKVYYNGISHNIPKVSGVINYGNITINGTGTVERFVWIGTDISELHTAVNYGTTNISNPNVGGFATYKSGAKASYCMNFSDIVGANIYDNATYNNVDTVYLVDISGNKGVYPNGDYVYSTDSTITSVSHIADVAFNTFGEAIDGMEPQSSLTSTITRNITYNDVIKPEFGIRYNNPLATEYITAATKKEYNGDNGLEYAEVNELRGKLRTTVDSLNSAGGFVVTAFNNYGANVIGLPLERQLLKYLSFDDEYWSTTRNNGVYLKDKYNDIILQVDGNSWVEIADFTLKSQEQYETKDGSMEYITTRSSLIPFQATIDTNEDGVYHNKVIVTVADLYMVTNSFKDVTTEPVIWVPTIKASNSATISYLKEPIISDTAEEFLTSIKEFVVDENSTINVGETSDTISLQLEDLGKIRYAIVGVLTSEDGTHQNVIALKLHSAGNIPLGYITSFVYPTAVASDGRSYVFNDVCGNGVNYYNETNRFVPTTSDGYTIETGVQHTETWGDLEYPIYNITENMVHTSDGVFVKVWGNGVNAIQDFVQGNNSYNLTIDYKMQNITKTKMCIIDSSNKEYIFEENAPADGVATKDGINIIKNGDTKVGTDTYKRTSDSVTLSVGYNDNNPFYRAGDKRIVCLGYTENNDEIILFKINVHKNSSFENYFKQYIDGFRKDLLNENGSTAFVVDVGEIGANAFVGDGASGYAISTLGKIELVSITYGERIIHGDYTNYPSTVTRRFKVTAEDGSIAYYNYTMKLPDISVVGIGIGGGYGGDASSKLQYANGVITLPAQYNNFAAIFSLGQELRDDKIYNAWGIAGEQSGSFNFLKCEKYVNGEYVGDIECNRDNLKYYGVKQSENDVYDPETGMGFYTSTGWNSGIVFYKDTTIAGEDFPDDVITYRCVMDYKLEDGTYATVQLRDITYQKTLRSDRQLISSTATNKLMTTSISTIENDFDDVLDIDANGVIDYTNQPADNNKLYLLDVYEPNVTLSQISYKISNTATLQKYNASNNTWATVFNASTMNDTYTYTQTFTSSQLGAGVTNKFRILAQDYTANDTEKATHIYYFDHSFYAATRNKDVQIVFKTDDETTMQLYNEIIANQGSLAIQIKNMNGVQATLQQTKMYYNNSNMESTYYKLSQGDFAVDVQVPEGYTPKVRIIGVSTEGWLQDNPVVRGKRIRLPYPNAQTYRLEVYLERNEQYPYWGIEHYQSFYKEQHDNHI